jgi:formylglycine-generating enzyme required for sulfatase activity
MDMSGNAWEWVSDWYAENYYASSPVDSPTGPSTGQMRVLRGGGPTQRDGFGPTEYRPTYRLPSLPTARDSTFGFRCGRGLDKSSN